MAATEDGQPISEFIGFPEFVGWMLSHQKYGVVVHGYRPGGGLEVGVLGYVVALAQFLALIAGGLVVYVILADKPFCEQCSKYLKSTRKCQLPFSGDMTVVTELRKTHELSAEYFQGLSQLPAGTSGALELELSRCPGCQLEALVERPMLLKDGKLAYQGELYRTVWAPVGTSIEESLARVAPAVRS